MPRINYDNYSETVQSGSIIDKLQNAKVTLDKIYEDYAFATPSPSVNFAGINSDAVDALALSIRKYIDSAQSFLGQFSSEMAVERGLKGPAAKAAQIFFDSVRTFLIHYISILSIQEKEVLAVKAQFEKSSADISTQISQDANELRKAAESIKVDDGAKSVSTHS